jgi:hypothetical protein
MSVLGAVRDVVAWMDGGEPVGQVLLTGQGERRAADAGDQRQEDGERTDHGADSHGGP